MKRGIFVEFERFVREYGLGFEKGRILICEGRLRESEDECFRGTFGGD